MTLQFACDIVRIGSNSVDGVTHLVLGESLAKRPFLEFVEISPGFFSTFVRHWVHVAGGTLRFGRALAIGALIAVVASLCYVATWEVIYFKLAPDFMAKYETHVLEKARADGESAESIARKKADMDKFAVMYSNPAINAAITFIEPLPVALIVALVSAGILSRRRKIAAEDNMTVAARG